MDEAITQGGALPYLGGFDGSINPDKWIDYMVMSCLAASTVDGEKFVGGVMVLEALMREKLEQNTLYQDGMRLAADKIRPDEYRANDGGAEKKFKAFQMAVESLALIVQQIQHRQLIHIAYGLRPGEGAGNHVEEGPKPEEVVTV